MEQGFHPNPSKFRAKLETFIPLTALGLFAGLAWLGVRHGLPLPFCPFRALTGIPCPICGSTRAAMALLQLDIPAACQLNPLFVVVVFVILLRTFLLLIPSFPRTFFPSVTPAAKIKMIGGLIFANWIYLVC
ncbi:MAG: DUF2752 domain-containing protein [Verrucomicrobiae bacterium]|nr:DUF2752 domain-containing protein [Verrucomicrobiae bacterium]